MGVSHTKWCPSFCIIGHHGGGVTRLSLPDLAVGGSLVVLGLLAGLTWAPVNVILFLCWMVLLVPPSSLHTTQLQRVEQLLRIGIPIGVILLSGWTAWVAYEAIQDPPLDDYLLDIGFNTYLAADSFLMGLNPYTEICQLYHEIRPQEGVILPENYPLTLGAKGAGDILLYGWPYRHGFPYFPMMFLGYVPFVAFFEGLDAMRMANAVFGGVGDGALSSGAWVGCATENVFVTGLSAVGCALSS